ncbi:MAG TPA: GNAT family N-acetyltransferase [Caldisericia bacterium]|nr:GNAT family N-acetyltransferase [Caldisericia bacterium]HPF48356.1 GNAT family N-acetyltransferase [Caldisericia bacterium]HPI83465.1 GNAT family N-acetyltransferase [Caldisericia bacterium]HPQ92809.1 GNAT family N-acetyltransferase [Caldisericia bacterium]HRV74093.1 GNAT family N-acetyltransferase [Caldisericia bacterium]
MLFEVKELSAADLKNNYFSEYVKYEIEFRKDRWPDGDYHLSDESVMRWLNDTNSNCVRLLAFMGNNIVGGVQLNLLSPNDPDYKINKNNCYMFGCVYRGHRNNGVGTNLLQRAIDKAKELGVSNVNCNAVTDDGNRFIAKFGGVPTSVFSDMGLEITDIDWDKIDKWKKIDCSEDNEWTVELHTKVTDEFIEDILGLSFATTIELRSMNNSSLVAVRESERKKWEESRDYCNDVVQYHCFVVKDDKNRVVGFTEGGIHGDESDKFRQYITTVDKSNRGRGLGKFLKALMLDHVRKEHPEIRLITTGNNDLNVAMKGINESLGFVCRQTETYHRLSVNTTLEILHNLRQKR